MAAGADSEAWAAFKLDVESASTEMQECLLALEESPGYDHALLNSLYRSLHTFKGIARMMGLVQIEKVAHRAEDLVSMARDAQLALTPKDIECLLAAMDFLGEASLRAAVTTQDASPGLVAEMLEILGKSALGQPAASAPAASPMAGPTVDSGAPEKQRAGEELPDWGDGDIVLFDDLPETTAEASAESTPAEGSAVVAPDRSVAEPDHPEAATSTASQMAARGGSAQPPAASERPKVITSEDEYVRVKTSKVQELLDMSAEIGLAIHAATRHPALAPVEDDSFDNAVDHLDALVRDLRDAATSLALVPIGNAFGRMRRAIRDLSKETGKLLELRIEGSETEVEKAIVDRIADPLLHLLRNAADHGIETPEQRRAAGKPERATIVLSAVHLGGEVAISLSDDGRGLDRDAILKRAVERGMIGPDAKLADEQVWNLILEPGFSTAAKISNLSGRGVGMDVVRNTVEELHGAMTIRSQRGAGTKITLHLPLSLAFLEGLVLRSGACAYVVPVDAVSRVYRSTGAELRPVAAEHSDMVDVGDELAPVCWLDRFYGEAAPDDRGIADHVVVLLQTRRGKLALPIDEVIGTQQVTMKPLRGPFKGIRAASGCGILGSGALAIALDCERLHAHVV